MIEVLPPLEKYKNDTWRILPVKCYIDNFVPLRRCIKTSTESVTRRGGTVTSAEGEAAPGRGKGGDDASWADVNLIGPKNEENLHS
jgi:hypothetical protein